MKKIISLILTVLIFVPCTFSAYAMPDPDLRSISLDITDTNDESVYIDILVNFDESDSYYTEYNSDNMKQYDFDTTELKEYDNSGYISFSCHHKDAKTDLRIKEEMLMADKSITKELIGDGKRLQIAVLDKTGHILQTSQPVLLKENGSFLYGSIRYDVDTNTVDPHIYSDPDYTGVAVLFFSIIGFVVIFGILLVNTSINAIAMKRELEKSGKAVVDSKKKLFENTIVLTLLFMTAAVAQGFVNPIDADFSLTFVIIPAILTVIFSVITDNSLRLIIPDIAYITVISIILDGLGGYIIFDIPIMLAVQIFIQLIASIIRKHKNKRLLKEDTFNA